ncbi:DUF4785 domain-containing protein [Wenzhouxiangella marina]|uniref:Uncharacterized protein n=1 Tax=Wenzhouxiangella marina TaxID=1579979 RepID=A0A0K0XSZ5_9GAMM|nr:DUF4785 domain-containing protein [Wenzhouxiangella marina]AKS40808.1 hypothetical protein WM2015_426 [Wenzhouxiangella marina]MBB6087682.1 hypothetical protein [Wenzhouxiangella marina]
MKLIKTLTLTSLLALSTIAMAQVEWLPAGNNDLQASQLERSARNLPASLHHESAPINFAWGPEQALQGRPFNGGPTPAEGDRPQATSRGYFVDVTGAELARGVELPLSAPGAVIRVSALESGSRLSLDPAALRLNMNGRPISADFGQGNVATGRDLRDQGMRVPEDSLAFRLGRDSSAGQLQLSHGGLPQDQALVIHVHEPNSEWVATLSLPRQNFLSGEALTFDLGIGNARQSVSARSVQAVLVSPDAAQTWPLGHARNGQLTIAAAPMAARMQPGAGLYEARVYAETEVNGVTVRRDLSLALNIAPAIARFNGAVSKGRSAGLNLNLGVETIASGRYQVNAEVYGTNARGQLEPLAFVQSAAVLGAGRGSIQLDVDAGLLRSSGLSAPYEVRNLMLLDQGRMYLLEQRERALHIAR